MNKSIYLSLLTLFFLTTGAQTSFAKKCVAIFSYHPGMSLGDGTKAGLLKTMEGKCEFSFFYMDTKRNSEREQIQKMAKKAKEFIEEKKPDLVFVVDDDAVADVLMAFYKNAALPFVFTGVNWTAEKYGLPYSNATGILELDPIQPLIQELVRNNDKLKTIAKISSDTAVDQMIYKHGKKYFESSGIEFINYPVSTFEQWKSTVLSAQEKHDAIYWGGIGGIKNFDEKEAIAFLEKNLKKVSVSNGAQTTKFATFAVAKHPEEFGIWAGQTALKILNGAKPMSIPIAVNKEFDTYINTKFLAKFPLKFSEGFSKRAKRGDGWDLK